MQVPSSSKGSAASLSRTTASVSSVGTFVSRLTTPKLTIWLEWMGVSPILSTKWTEFLTYDENLPVSGSMISTKKRLNGWHAEHMLLTMGPNGIPFLWIFGRPYMCGKHLKKAGGHFLYRNFFTVFLYRNLFTVFFYRNIFTIFLYRNFFTVFFIEIFSPFFI